MYPVPGTRLLVGALDASISHQFYDSDGDPANPGTVTVEVTRSNGDDVTVGAVTGSGTNPRSVTVGVAELAEVDWLTATWSLGGDVIATDTIEVVGGFIGSVEAIKRAEPTLANADDDDIKRARAAAEDRFLSACNRSPVARFYRERTHGTGGPALWNLTWPDIQRVLWVRSYTSATTYTEYTAEQLAAIPFSEYAWLERTDGGIWSYGRSNIEIGYRFGMISIPNDLQDALYRAVRIHYTNAQAQGVPSGLEAYTSIDGIAYRPTIPGQRGAIYRDDDVNAVYARYMDPRPVLA